MNKKSIVSGSAAFMAVTLLFFLPLLVQGRMVAIYDDGVWLAITRLWQRGARLYVDLWDNKPPLLFWYLRYALAWPANKDFAANHAGSPEASATFDDISIRSIDLVLFWLPVICCYLFFLRFLIKRQNMSAMTASIFGMSCAALLLSPRIRGSFGSESIALVPAFLALVARDRHSRTGFLVLFSAAALINAKFLPLVLLAPGPWPWQSIRSWIAPVLAATTLIAVVTFSAIPPTAASWQALAETTTTSIANSPGLWDKLGNFTARSLFSSSFSLFAPFFSLTTSQATLAGIVFLVAIAIALSKMDLAYAAGFATQAVLLVYTGTAWSHSVLLFAPYVVPLIAHWITDRSRRRRHLFQSLMAAFFCISLAYDWMLVQTSLKPAAVVTFRQHATEFSDDAKGFLGGDKWISLLGNGVPVWAVRGIHPPSNRTFHNYCLIEMRWAQREILQLLAGSPMKVLVMATLNREACGDFEVFQLVYAKCKIAGSSLDPAVGQVDFLDCPRIEMPKS